MLETMVNLLEVLDLTVTFPTPAGPAPVVNGVSLRVERGEAVAVVGESGCGKSMTAFSIFRLVPGPGLITGGRVLLKGRDLLQASEKELCSVRGREMAMVFQDPLSALNPVMTVGAQIMEAVRAHEKVSRTEARDRAIESMRRVGLPSAARRMDDYPHQFSGGMRQRVLIAMALVCGPSLLVADEPTTAIDVTVQARIMDLLDRLRKELKMAVILITHDMGVVARFAGRVYVMYCGMVVEEAPVETLFSAPGHPYTRGLLACVPRIGENATRLRAIPGSVPPFGHVPPGCPFAPRCGQKAPLCEEAVPPLRPLGDGHFVRCVFANEDES